MAMARLVPRIALAPRLRLVVGAVEIEHELVDPALVEGVQAFERIGDLVVDEPDGLADTLADVAIAAVAKFDRFVLAGRRAGRHRRPSEAIRSRA